MNVGEAQSLFTFANLPPTSSFRAGTGVFFGEPPPTVANPEENTLTGQVEPIAQNGGTMQVRIAGSVINSIFSASVAARPDVPDRQRVRYPARPDPAAWRHQRQGRREHQQHGNNLVDPASTGRAFFAKSVKLIHGPVIPPTVPYQPFAAPTKYFVGQNGLKGLFKIDHVPAVVGGHKTTKKKK